MDVTGLLFLRALTIIQALITRGTDLIFGVINGGKSRRLPPISDPIILESASSLARKIRKREVTSEQVVQSFVARIGEVNGLINAMVDDRFQRAIEEARAVDRFLSTGANVDESRLANDKPFLGVPFTIKENFKVGGKRLGGGEIAVKSLRQTVGLAARRHHVSIDDADAVIVMRESGAILLGVTNLSELCTWWESRNNVYGQTNNPYDTTRVAGGSSGGEGSIIGAAASVMGIGSDIGGSIRMPAFFNGIFGHKPSPGVVSNVGQLPEAVGPMADFLSTGPMCRYAVDLIPLLKVLAGPNVKMLKLDKLVDVKSIKIYYMEDDGGFPLVTSVSDELRVAHKKVLMYFERAHGVDATRVCFPAMARSLELWASNMCGSGAPSFCEEMVQKKGKLNIYSEFLKWCVGKSDHTFPAIALGFLEKVEMGRGKEEHDEIVRVCRKLKDNFERVLGDDGIFLYPSFPTVAPFHYQPLFTPFNFSYPAIFNILGLPVTQCPLGLSVRDRVPLGIQVVSSVNNDHLCLAVAAEIERAFGGWVSPSDVI